MVAPVRDDIVKFVIINSITIKSIIDFKINSSRKLQITSS